MTISPPVVKAQTLKQAKAAYKARGRPAVSEREQKRLERARELDRRAWRLREQEKKRAEALKKKPGPEHKAKAEKDQVLLGSQRRRDKFGNKSSQFHLGAYFGGGVAKNDMREQEKENVMDEEDAWVSDDGIDDDTLIGALGDDTRHVHFISPVLNGTPKTSNEKAALQPIVTQHPPTTGDDLSALWDELDSSTQIAREIAVEESRSPQVSTADNHTGSFDYGDIDATAEEIADLDPTPEAPTKADADRKLMPPPALSRNKEASAASSSCGVSRAAENDQTLTSPNPHSLDTGFTLSQLEELVADDLQLTQAPPD